MQAVTTFALNLDPVRENWKIVTGPRRKKYLYHVPSGRAWSGPGAELPAAAAFALTWNYAVIAANTRPL